MKHHTSDIQHDSVAKSVEKRQEVLDALRTSEKSHSEKDEKIKHEKATKKYRLYTKDHKHRLNRPLL